MGKKDKKKNKGKAPELTKKERKALEAREAELVAELSKTKGKKSKKAKPEAELEVLVDAVPEEVTWNEPATEYSPEQVIAAADKVLADKNASKGAVRSAVAAKGRAEAKLKADPDAFIDELKAKVEGKKLARAAGLDPDAVDRADEDAVKAYNEAVVAAGGPAHLLTSDAERKREADRLKDDEPMPGVKPRKAKPDEMVVEIETENGREFVAGPAKDDDAEPAKAEPVDEFKTVDDNAPKVERDALGRPRILNPATGKVKSYTRVTTYIDNLEDKTALDKWKLRTLLEGIALNEGDAVDKDKADYYVGQARDAMHVRDVALAKINKADRKGKLETGERGTLEAAAFKVFKSTLDAIAHEALELGGVHERAQKGTDLHALAELYDMQGMGVINDKLKMHEITPADHADIVAYASAMMAAEVKVLECEQMVVIDELGVAGTLDRLVLAKLPGAKRAVRMVADIKTGRVDYGVGKIAQQVGMYSRGKGYDPAKPEARRDLKANLTKGLLIHLPQGEARCTIHVIDLTLGAKGNKLSREVRAWRNEGKKAIELKVDLAATVVAE